MTSPPLPESARAALERLRAGNQRFLRDVRSIDSLAGRQRLAELQAAQNPFAVILGCSDSRAPAELLFDQGLGDLFVIRVAGNVVAPTQIGSVEFAVGSFGTPLVVVLGHTRCGAIGAALDTFFLGRRPPTDHLRNVVDRVRPSIEPLLREPIANDPERLAREASIAHVRVGVEQLQHGSPLIEKAVQDGNLAVVGALYDLASGVVEFL